MQHLDSLDFASKIKELIDSLKAICASYGLGNDGNEFKIITQVFLYKFTNDKFAYEVKNIDEEIAKWEQVLKNKTEDEYEFILLQLPPNTAQLKPEHFISTLFEKQNDDNFAKLFDDTLRDIAIQNSDIFSVKTEGDTKIPLFDRVSEFITDTYKRDAFCKAMINQLVKFSAEHIFTQKYDFFATLFEYLIKDYNKDNGGKYAEYYTPHAVAKIMAAILVKDSIPYTRHIPPDTLILSNSATPGLPRIVKISAGVHDGWLIIMNYKKGLTQEFMYHYFSFEQRRVVSFGSGSIFKNLKTDYIKNLKIALPPKLILEKVCPKFKEISELISIKSQENQQLTQLRDWLLPMLMNGQITIK